MDEDNSLLNNTQLPIQSLNTTTQTYYRNGIWERRQVNRNSINKNYIATNSIVEKPFVYKKPTESTVYFEETKNRNRNQEGLNKRTLIDSAKLVIQ